MDRDPEERTPTTRFGDRAAAYAAGRPDYPAAAIDAVLERLGDRPRVADVGAGTGISSRLLAARGCAVDAVEPNAEMRGAAADVPGIVWHAATGEATGLDAASVNLVCCAQAFHWLDAAAAVAEFHRILVPGGRLALVWNVHDADDPATAAYRAVILAHETEPPTSPWATEIDVAGRIAPHFRGYGLLRVPHEQQLDETGLLRRAASSSYLPRSGPAAAALAGDLRALFGERAEQGRFRIRYRCEVHLAERAP